MGPAVPKQRSSSAPDDDAGFDASDRYELLGLLGTGGMARVHLARARGPGGMDRLVVIKRPLSHLAEDPQFLRMFLDEARIASTLHHTNIAQVYDVEERHGSVSIVMEFLHGHDVRDLMRALAHDGAPLPLEHALSIVLGVSNGMSYAHNRTDLEGRPLEIVHRDVSPHNVFVTFDGQVKLIDFGVARAAMRRTNTVSGTIKGKLGYMAPEQVLGEAVDCRADLFALGVILYELTTGARLFQHASEYLTMHSILYDDPLPPSSRVPGYPPALEAIVVKCLARDPDERYRSARELTLDLEEFARRERQPVSAVGLADFMASLFTDELARWREASSSGLSLSEHLEATRTVLGLSTVTDEPAIENLTRPTIPATPAARGRARRRWIAGAALALIAASAGGIAVSRHRHAEQPPARATAPADPVVVPLPAVAEPAAPAGPTAAALAVPPGQAAPAEPPPAAEAAPSAQRERPTSKTRVSRRPKSRRASDRARVPRPAKREVDPDGLLID